MCVIYQNIYYWWNCLHVANVTEFIATEIKWTQSREVCQPYCKLVKNSRLKKCIKQCLGGLKRSRNTKKNKKTREVSFKAIFNVHFANLVSKEYFSCNVL